ncbi:hypothetical protein [Streptomyces hydrogenans]
MSESMASEIRKARDRSLLHKRIRGDENPVIKELHVRFASSLSGLDDFAELEVLILSGCDFPSLSEIPTLRRLVSLTVSDSSLRDVDGIERFPELLVLDIQRNHVVDLDSLTESGVRNLAVDGNPLSRHSYEQVLPQLEERGCRVSRSGDREWRVSARMHEVGAPFVCYERGGSYFLCSPGLSVTEQPARDHPKVDPDELEGILDMDPGELMSLFRSRGGVWPPPPCDI